MGHSISGFIAREKELTELVEKYDSAHVISLTQEFAFVPMTDEFYDQLIANRQFLADIADERFRYLSSKLFQIGREFSKKTPIAYVETDYFGGEGFQSAVAWDDGDAVVYPAVAGKEEGFQMDGNHRDPINYALLRIGVNGYLMNDESELPKDEYDELGLGKHRDNEDWIKSATAEKT